jgi:predicted alpha/beta-fold hydrolase
MIAAVGYSLGGNVLLKWLGESGKQASLTTTVAVSVPFLLASSSDRIAKGFSRVYQWKLLRSLRRKVKQKLQRMPLNVRTSDLDSLKNFRMFDDAVTAPLHGFRDVEHYYATASSRQYLKDINVDTLILHARDDPFMMENAIPTAEELSEKTQLELYPCGGHEGFVAGTWPWRPSYWLETRIVEHLILRLNINQTAAA